METVQLNVGSISEIVEQVLQQADEETLKSARAVDRTWLAESQKFTQLVLNMLLTKKKRRKLYKLLANSKSGFRNFHVIRQVPQQLTTKFQQQLSCLTLSNVTFMCVQDMKAVIFFSFPNMRELELNQVSLRMKLGFPTDVDLIPDVPLKKLEIHSGIVPRDTVDAFDVLEFSEVFKCFSSIESLNYNEFNYMFGSRKQRFFKDLCSSAASPSKLNFQKSFNFVPDNELEREHFRSFINVKGHNLRHVGGLIPGEPSSVLACFGEFDNANITSLVLGLDWNEFGVGMFENLRQLTILHCEQTSLRFLSRMPELKMVDYWFDETTKALNKSKKLQGVDGLYYLSPKVEQIGINGYSNRPHCRQIFKSFPNVKRVTISGGNGCNLASCLKNVAKHWPNLVSLKLRGSSGLYNNALGDVNVGDGIGNVSRVNLELIVTSFEDLEVFDQWDNFGKIGEDLDNDSLSFDSDDEEDPQTKLCFGDEDAWRLMSLPKLRTLRLKRVSMSPKVVETLKRRMFKLEIGTFVQSQQAVKAALDDLSAINLEALFTIP